MYNVDNMILTIYNDHVISDLYLGLSQYVTGLAQFFDQYELSEYGQRLLFHFIESIKSTTQQKDLEASILRPSEYLRKVRFH